MSHLVSKHAYRDLVERINRFPQGAPPSKTLYRILKMLFSREEAELVSKLPIRPFNVRTAAKRWSMSEKDAKVILDNLADRAILLDTTTGEDTTYILPPPMAGFFEFSMMRLNRSDLNQELLASLFYQYLNEEEDFVKELFYGTKTKLGRVYVNESVLTKDQTVTILDFERASSYVLESKHMGISTCYCRHKMHHMNKACDAPLDICMTFGNTADSLIRHGHARRVDKVEGMELLHLAYESNLVQCGENVRNNVTFICNCCGCCCEAMVAAKKFGNLHPVVTTRFMAYIEESECVNCGKCVKICPVAAIEGDADNTVVKEELCLGCGVCLRNCKKGAIHFKERKEKIITPANSVHRAVLMALEKGQLQHFIFDNKALYSHRAMAAIISAILKLPPVKQAMATEQMRSVYLERIIERFQG